jgi:hypothetical protein
MENRRDLVSYRSGSTQCTNMHGDKTVAGRTVDAGGRRRSLWKSPALITALLLLIIFLLPLSRASWGSGVRLNRLPECSDSHLPLNARAAV